MIWIILAYIIGYILCYRIFRNYTHNNKFRKKNNYNWGNILYRSLLCLFYPLLITCILVIFAMPFLLIYELITEYNDIDGELNENLPKPPKWL